MQANHAARPTPRTVASAATVTSLILGGGGLIAPAALGGVFGVDLTPTTAVIARLACAAYLGYGVLSWLARDVVEPGAWRAIAGASAISWGLSASVVATALVSGVGNASAWAIAILQVGFTLAWSLAYVRGSSLAGATVTSDAR